MAIFKERMLQDNRMRKAHTAVAGMLLLLSLSLFLPLWVAAERATAPALLQVPDLLLHGNLSAQGLHSCFRDATHSLAAACQMLLLVVGMPSGYSANQTG